MKRKISTICMFFGTAFIFSALFLFLLNERQARQAQQSAEELLLRVEQLVGESDCSLDVPDPYDVAMTEKEIDGYLYIGYLSIPSLSMELPIMSNWSYAQLRVAPCRYSGSAKSDNLVLMAHNYKSHFGNISKLEVGDEVQFTDMDGVVSKYQVTAKDVLLPTAVDEMTAGEYDLALFTCTYGGKSRITICCDRMDVK